MEGSITWVGIDAHKKTLAVAAFLPSAQEPEEFTIDNDERAIRKLVRRLERDSDGREIRICYEAGTCGYALQRRIEASGGVVCEVIAPSLIPRKPGERIKTDRRDARKLAELYRAGVLTTVAPPTPDQEAIRDLCRCREDVRADLGRCRHRLIKMLVRRGYVFNVTSRLWSDAHRKWLAALSFDNEVDRIVVTEYKLAVEQAERRLRAMDSEIEKAGATAAVSRARRVAPLLPRHRHDHRDDLRRGAPRRRALRFTSCARCVLGTRAQSLRKWRLRASWKDHQDRQRTHIDAHSSKHLGSIAITPALARNYVSAKRSARTRASRSLTRLNVASPDVIDDSPPVGRTATRSSSLSHVSS